MNPLEIRLIAYGILALGVVGVTAWATHKVDSARYDSLRADFSEYRAQVSKDNADAHKAFADALQAQITERTATETRNAQLQTSLQTVQAEAVAAQRDADFARRLLAAAANTGAAAAGHQMSKADGGSEPPSASGASGDRSTPNLLRDVTDSAAECRDAIQRLATLQFQLSPQL